MMALISPKYFVTCHYITFTVDVVIDGW